MLGGTKLLVRPMRQLSFLSQPLKNSSIFQVPLPQPPRTSLGPGVTFGFPKAFTQEIIPKAFIKNNLLNFKQLFPPNSRINENLVKIPSRSSLFSIELPKYISSGKKDNPKTKKVPKLILLQNPFTWLMAKIDFKVLRSIWDPQFVEADFKLGTKQAISRVTQVISEGKYDELNGLLTKPARLSLMRDLDRNWSRQRRAVLELKSEDIQISSPRKVHFIRIDNKKFCDVDMCFMALKWVPMKEKEALIFADIFARFHREYTPHSIPEWTIAFFKVKRLQLVRAKTV